MSYWSVKLLTSIERERLKAWAYSIKSRYFPLPTTGSNMNESNIWGYRHIVRISSICQFVLVHQRRDSGTDGSNHCSDHQSKARERQTCGRGGSEGLQVSLSSSSIWVELQPKSPQQVRFEAGTHSTQKRRGGAVWGKKSWPFNEILQTFHWGYSLWARESSEVLEGSLHLDQVLPGVLSSG